MDRGPSSVVGLSQGAPDVAYVMGSPGIACLRKLVSDRIYQCEVDGNDWTGAELDIEHIQDISIELDDWSPFWIIFDDNNSQITDFAELGRRSLWLN